MGAIVRLAMLAASAGGAAHATRRIAVRLAALLALTLLAALLGAGAVAALGFALFFGLVPRVDPSLAALIVAACFVVIAALIWVAARRWYLRPAKARPRLDVGTAAPLAALPALEIGRMIERNAVGVLLAAFVAGMMTNRRR